MNKNLTEELDRGNPLYEGNVTVRVERSAVDVQEMVLTFRALTGYSFKSVSEVSTTTNKQELLHIEITSDEDHFFLYTFEITEQDFHSLKKDQALLIDFKGFPSKLVELLRECDNEKFFAILDLRAGANLNIVEANKFKHLSHLSLKFKAATDATLKRYLASRLKDFITRHKDATHMLHISNQTLENTSKSLEVSRTELEKFRLQATQSEDNLRHEIQQQNDKILNEERSKSLKTLKQTQKELNDQLHEAKVTADKRITFLEQKLTETVDINIQHEKDLTTLKSDKQQLENQLKIVGSSNDFNSEEMKRLKEENQAFSAEVARLNNENTRFTVLNQSLTEQVKDKVESLSKSTQLSETYRTKLKTFEQKLIMYKDSTKKLQDKLNESINEINKGGEFISNLQTDLKSQKLKLKNRNMVIKQQEKYVDKLKNELSVLEREKTNLKAELNNEKLANSQFKDLLQVREEKLKNYANIIDSNKNVITYLNNEINKQDIHGAKDFDFSGIIDEEHKLDTNPKSKASIFTQMMHNQKSPESSRIDSMQDDFNIDFNFESLPDPEQFESSSHNANKFVI